MSFKDFFNKKKFVSSRSTQFKLFKVSQDSTQGQDRVNSSIKLFNI